MGMLMERVMGILIETVMGIHRNSYIKVRRLKHILFQSRNIVCNFQHSKPLTYCILSKTLQDITRHEPGISMSTTAPPKILDYNIDLRI